MNKIERPLDPQLSDPHEYANLSHGGSAPHAHRHSELPLIMFTLLVSLSVGVVAFSLVAGLLGLFDGPDGGAGSAAGPAFSVALVTVGMVASVVHLAKPLRAPTSLRHLSSSWLSREILLVAMYWGVLCVWVFATCALPSAVLLPLVLNALAVGLGIALLFVVARAYRVHAQPLWDGPECAMELFAVALGAGVSWGCVVAVSAPPMVETAVCGLALIGARFLYDESNASRLRRLGNPDTLRERAADKRLESLGGMQRRVTFIIDIGILLCLAFLALQLVVGDHAPTSVIVPACVSTVAFFEARARFYEMAVIVRPATRRNFR